MDVLLKFERSIDLTYDDYVRVGLAPHKPRSRPKAPAFNLEDALSRFRGTTSNGRTWNSRSIWNFGPAKICHTLKPEEAEFWLHAITMVTQRSQNPGAVAEELAGITFTGYTNLDAWVPEIRDLGYRVPPEVALAMANLGPPHHIVDVILGALKVHKLPDECASVLHGFENYVLPYLSETEYEALGKHLQEAAFKGEDNRRTANIFVCYLAALLGLREELKAVPTLTDGAGTGWFFDGHFHDTSHVLLMLGPGEHISRLRSIMTLTDQEMVRHWLAITEYADLDFITDTVMHASTDSAERLARGLARVHAPEAAIEMLRLYANSKAMGVAAEWFNENPAMTAVALLPIAARGGELATEAVAVLGMLSKRGHRHIVQAGIDSSTAPIDDALRAVILPADIDLDIPLIDDSTMPSALAQATSRKLSLRPDDPTPTGLSMICIDTPQGPRRLDLIHLVNLFAALRKSTFDAVHPYINVVKSVGVAKSLDAFAWALLDRWIEQGAPLKQKWWFYAVGYLGNDVSVFKLTPLLNEWRKFGHAVRAQQGLECLRAIGTDTALITINSIAQKAEYKSLRPAAIACMDRIAKQRGFTKSQLEDRIVPTCSLDERGTRIFDYGPRRFRLVLNPQLKPMLKDESGKLIPDLPKPGSKDDAALAETAASDWKLLKKQISQAAKVQPFRLEQAMITGRRWTASEIETLLVRHPLMTNLVRSIVWAAYDSDRRIHGTFRVTEDQTLAGPDDMAYGIPADCVAGIVHPLHLSDSDKAVWSDIFDDYEIIPPFQQLGRPVYRLTEEEVQATRILRFDDRTLPALAMVHPLDKRGWIRGPVGDGGWLAEHTKPFEGVNITAVIDYEPGVTAGMIAESEDQQLAACYCIPGLPSPKEIWNEIDNNLDKRLAWIAVDPVVVSEVLADLTAIFAKAK